MCGIVGVRHDWLVAQGLDPARALTAAMQTLAWRGPDGQAIATAGSWWLGCARLAITQPHSQQPVVRRGGRFVGVMNGAITNARQLWTRLLPGAERRPAPPNDAWLPLLAVEQHDPEALYMLRGHHAYAVVDVETGALVFGRDRYGEKPLLGVIERLGERWQLVAFASTPAALRAFGVEGATSSRRLAEWFRFGWAPEKVQRLPRRRQVQAVAPGEPWVTSAQDRGWGQRWGQSSDPQSLASKRTRAGVREELIASVARCTDTTVNAALSLSGGLDSSCLALALAAADRRLPAYQLRAAGAAAAERNAATAVARRAGLELRPVDIGVEVLDSLPFLTTCAGQPLGDPSILAVHAVARAAANDGVRVLLGGEGADELLLGYRRYRALAHLWRAPWLRPLAPRWSMRYAARLLRAITAADPIAALLAVTPPAFGDAVLAPELAKRRCWRDDSVADAHHRDLLLRARDEDLRGYLRCDLLPKVDIATMAAGIEARCPFLEGNFGTDAVPAALGKRQLREAFHADLPTEVLQLPKHGFSLPLDRWFRGDLPWLDLLAEPRTQQRPHLRPGGVRRVVDLHRRGRSNLGHGLYLLVACELFLRSLEPAATQS